MKKYFYYTFIFIICIACQMEEYDFSPHYNIPAVEVTEVTDLKHNRVTLNARVNDDYGYPITEKGFYYASTIEELMKPYFRKKIVSRKVGKGDYSITLIRLKPNTTYYYLPFATNELGTAVGRTVSKFTTTSLR